MNTQPVKSERKMTSIFERYLTLWVVLCIIGGIVLGKIAPCPYLLPSVSFS